MRIDSLELVGYKRLKVSEIKRFVIHTTDIIQLILGTNGSGKSSLLDQLTPLPANPNDFYKDGSALKTIRIRQRGNVYVLTSRFLPKAEHSFIKDGEELNVGGTITVQKELVRQEFHITQDTHDLMTGQEKFHSMSPSRRREWFTMLIETDYDYAMKVYNKLRTRARDFEGALRQAKKRLVNEITKVISVEEEKKLKKEVAETLVELELLMEHRAPVEKPVAEYENDQRAVLHELGQLSNRLLRMRFVAPYGHHPHQQEERNEWYELTRPGFNSIEEIDTVINQYRHEITAKETMINLAVTEHSKLKDTVDILTKTGEAGIDALTAQMVEVRAERDLELRKRKLGIEGIEPINATGALDSVYEVLLHVFSTISENEEKKYSQAALLKSESDLLVQKDVRTKMVAELTRLNSKRLHFEEHKAAGKTVCPKCQHSWVLGFSEEGYKQALITIAEKEEELKFLDMAIVMVEGTIVTIREYADLYRTFIRTTQAWPILNPLWDYLLEGQFVTRAPRKALSIVDTFRVDIGHELVAKKHEDKVLDIQALIRSAEQVGDASLAEVKGKLDETTLFINEMTATLATLHSSLAEYSQYRRQLAEATELGNKITNLMTSADKINKDMIEMLRRETIRHCIEQLQHKLALKQATLTSSDLQKGIIKELEKQVEEMTVSGTAADMLVQKLSPLDGLIAEGLLGFIRNFTGQMNALIRKIWTYPLQILECGVSSDAGAELDYKFRVLVQSKDNIVPDISKTSEGQCEVIDVAFKVIAMRFLHLEESPLFLDEFGKTFDEQHRVQASTTIKSLMDQQSFAQLFMISHYESTHGAYVNSEICVLDGRNITIPKKYNQHVTIEHY